MSFSPNSFLLSLSTGTVLTGLWCGRAIAYAVEALGEASETLFRGDCLPVLDLPDRVSEPTSVDTPIATEDTSPPDLADY